MATADPANALKSARQHNWQDMVELGRWWAADAEQAKLLIEKAQAAAARQHAVIRGSWLKIGKDGAKALVEWAARTAGVETLSEADRKALIQAKVGKEMARL